MATTEKPHEPNKEWVKVFDLDYSRYYFYNIPSGETHWELPSAIDDHDVIVAGAPESITALVVPRGEGAAAARLADVVMDNVTTGPRFILTPSEPIPGLPSPPLSPTLGPVEGGPRKSRIRSVVKGFANALGLRKKKKGAGPVEGGDDEAAGSGVVRADFGASAAAEAEDALRRGGGTPVSLRRVASEGSGMTTPRKGILKKVSNYDPDVPPPPPTTPSSEKRRIAFADHVSTGRLAEVRYVDNLHYSPMADHSQTWEEGEDPAAAQNCVVM